MHYPLVQCCLDAPSAGPTISSIGSPLYENDAFTISCTSQGGNPRANVSWNTLPEGFENVKVTKSPGTSTLSGKITRGVDGKMITCKASHYALLSTNYRTSSKGPLNVHCK